MSNELKIPKVFKPLFELIEGHHKGVTKVIVTGGRYSGKTFSVNRALANAVGSFGHRLAHTRYTASSLAESIILTFKKALDQLGFSSFFTINKQDINSTFNDSRVFFRGIKTGSKNQDSSLKGLEDVTIFAIDEASEIPSFEEWEKVDLSIRSSGEFGVSFSILILNPTHITHWIFNYFFKDRGVKAGFNGIVGDVMYIHSSWKDLEESMISNKHLPGLKRDEEFYNNNKLEDLTEQKDQKRWVRYRDVIMGGWLDSVDNVIFEYWDEFDEWPNEEPLYITLGLDFGFVDPNALVETRVYEDAIYTKLHYYQSFKGREELGNHTLAEQIKLAIEEIGEDVYTIADSARPEVISELNALNCVVVKCKKGPGSIKDGIAKINSTNLFVHKDSHEMHNELNNYHYVENINIKGERKIEPVDSFNHSIDALRYSLSLY